MIAARVAGVPRPDLQSPYNNICNDLAIDPRSGGQQIVANCAWRGGASYNGFYRSTDFGEHFVLVNPTGALNPQDVGRGSFAYAADGSHLYAVVESIVKYSNNKNTALGGVFDSPSGSVTGPWNRIADEAKLAAAFGEEYEAYRRRVRRWIPGLL